MAVLFMDGMDTYTAIADVGLRYPAGSTSTTSLQTTGGRFGGGAVSFNSNAAASLLGIVNIAHSGSGATVVGGCLYPATTANVQPAIGILNTLGNGTSSFEMVLYYDTGLFKLYRGNSNLGTLLGTSTLSYPNQTWHHLELKVTIADAGGTAELRVNGVVAINFTGDTRASTTGTAGVDRVHFATYVTGATGGQWDDIYILDTSGSVANDFLGDVRINTLAPTSDSSVQFTRSTGASNFSCVDEGRMNSDTDYVESSTSGHVDKYGYADLAAGVTTVYGVQAISWVKKTDAGPRTFRSNLYSGASTANGTTGGLTITYSPVVALATLNPSGSIQWTPTTVNAALGGYEIVT